jgi:acetylornithine/succinyldiaminopimelate/putrescine aminotransferase
MVRTATPPAVSIAGLLGRQDVSDAAKAADEYLAETPRRELLARTGETIERIPPADHFTKGVFQASYGGRREGEPDDLLAGRGVFLVTERRKLMLDCTAGHYQMTWGYQHPVLTRLVRECVDAGVAWDAHSNIPGAPVKRLSYKLVELCNPGVAGLDLCDESTLGDGDVLNTVLLGVCTGSVACSTALKIMLVRQAKVKGTPPVMVTLDGNYHGTDIFAQRMRGMWGSLFRDVDFVNLEPNDIEGAARCFREYGERIMGFMCEPIMMNREALLLEPEFARAVRRMCDEVGALFAVDEIQTGFWAPGCFHYLRWGITPDFVICGKGMSAGFHPLAAVIYRRPLDLLAQYDSISTNGNAPLPAMVALGSIALIEAESTRIARVIRRNEQILAGLAERFPDTIESVQGEGLLSGLRFRRVEDAIEFHCRCVDRGLWLRVHAYHPGHRTVLMKFALCVDEDVLDFVEVALSEQLASL